MYNNNRNNSNNNSNNNQNSFWSPNKKIGLFDLKDLEKNIKNVCQKNYFKISKKPIVNFIYLVVSQC